MLFMRESVHVYSLFDLKYISVRAVEHSEHVQMSVSRCGSLSLCLQIPLWMKEKWSPADRGLWMEKKKREKKQFVIFLLLFHFQRIIKTIRHYNVKMNTMNKFCFISEALTHIRSQALMKTILSFHCCSSGSLVLMRPMIQILLESRNRNGKSLLAASLWITDCAPWNVNIANITVSRSWRLTPAATTRWNWTWKSQQRRWRWVSSKTEIG